MTRTDVIWKTEALAQTFLEGVRGAIPLAPEQIDVMLRVIKKTQPNVNTFLDLGCGDGILGRAIHLTFVDTIKRRTVRGIKGMASSKNKSSDSKSDRIVYSEFGPNSNPAAVERAVQELPPNQQNLRVQASRKGRKGKTVTVISGFQAKPETLTKLLKQLKNQCGTGGTVKDDTLEIQGDHAQKLVELLTQLGYKAKISGG
jgi:translation initiation factor 1